ncbi:MAG: hypothetical protein KDC67_12300 [Ignavibacteriae bacterium]|nr:hypothetical protein [Ignavibacteriota bacterium]
MKKQKSQNLSKKEKLKLVMAKYCLKSKKSIELKTVSYREKLYLLAAFRALTNESFNMILPLNNEGLFKTLSPNKDMDENILDCLYSSDIILVNPGSDLDSFQFKNNKCVGFKVDEVSWIVNLSSQNGKRLELSDCYRLIYDNLTKFVPTSEKERNQVYSFTMNLALNEVESYIQFKMDELNYRYELGKKTYIYIFQLLNFLSVSEIYDIIDKAIDVDYLSNSRIELKTKCYGSGISSNLLELGEMAKREELSIKKMPRKKSLNRSELSRVFYQLIHMGGDEGFVNCPIDFWNETLTNCYTSTSE